MANVWFNQSIFLFNLVSWNHPKYVPWFDILLLDLDNALLQQSNVVKAEHCHKVQSVLGQSTYIRIQINQRFRWLCNAGWLKSTYLI